MSAMHSPRQDLEGLSGDEESIDHIISGRQNEGSVAHTAFTVLRVCERVVIFITLRELDGRDVEWVLTVVRFVDG